jgi:hypothetical protein
LEAGDIIGQAESVLISTTDPLQKQQLQSALTALLCMLLAVDVLQYSAAVNQFAKVTEVLAPVAQDIQCRIAIENAGTCFVGLW